MKKPKPGKKPSAGKKPVHVTIPGVTHHPGGASRHRPPSSGYRAPAGGIVVPGPGAAKKPLKKPPAGKGGARVSGKVQGAAKKPRQFTPDGDVALCSARAVAESLRLALGVAVADEDVLELYWRTADDADAGASILATLEAAAEFGLTGVRPGGVGAWRRLVLKPQPSCHPPYAEAHITQLWPASTFRGPALIPDSGPLPVQVILGVNLPAPHAVLATPDGWWSWGELHEPWTGEIEEAWAVSW